MTGSYRLGVVERSLAAGQLERVHCLQHVLDRNRHHVDTRPMRAFVEAAPGIGLGGFARLLGATGPLDRFATVSKLWAYLGMHVVDGIAPRHRRGQRANWSAQGRVVCHQLGVAIVRVRRGRYRTAYDRKKAEYLARPRLGPSACPFGQTHTTRKGEIVRCGLAHAHVAAMRYAVKILVRDLWGAWRTHNRDVPRQVAAEPSMR